MKNHFVLLLSVLMALSFVSCHNDAVPEPPVLSTYAIDNPNNTTATPTAIPEATVVPTAIPNDVKETLPASRMPVIEATSTPLPTITAMPTPTATPRPLVQEISVGQTVSTKYYDFTSHKVELIYELKPRNTRGYYRYYSVDNGKIYVHIDGTFYNTSKKDLCIEDLIVPKAEYDNGYKYEGFVVIDDGDTGFDWVSSYIACTPLTSCHYHGLIECPEIIESSDAPLFVSLRMADGITYQYNIR